MATRLAKLLMSMAIGLASAAAFGAEPASETTRNEARDAAANPRIAYWTSDYSGAELGSCEPPRVPALSRSNVEIRAIGRAINAWQRCHNTLVERLRAPVVLEGQVEPDVLAAMGPVERQAAQQHVEAVHARLLRTVEADAVATMRWHRDWLATTADHAAAENAGQKASRKIVARNEESARRFRKEEREARRQAAQDSGH